MGESIVILMVDIWVKLKEKSTTSTVHVFLWYVYQFFDAPAEGKISDATQTFINECYH
jgi:hypothetical protein